MNQDEKLSALRGELSAQGLDGFLVPRADEFLGEYVCAHGERLKWVSGFSGSAGMVCVTADKAAVITDGRYTERVKKELEGTSLEYAIIDRGGESAAVAGWLKTGAKHGSVIGYDPMMHTAREIAALKEHLGDHVTLKSVERNPVDAVWKDQPALPAGQVFLFPDEVAGRSAADKCDDVAVQLRNAGVAALMVADTGAVNWLLNIRGDDVPYVPFALSYAIAHDDGRVDWFINSAKVPQDVRNHLGPGVSIHDPAVLKESLTATAKNAIAAGRPIWIDENTSAIWFNQTVEQAGAKILNRPDPCIAAKAIKTPQEQAAIRDAHMRDAVAMVKFLCWLDHEAPKGDLTEVKVMDRLEGFRREDPDLTDLSFNTIAGWKGNGADIHYAATPESNARIVPPGILLVDSGGQYKSGGTTDITRTVTVGTPTQDEKNAFTRVLKGHIAVAACSFPDGTLGRSIDPLARMALWEDGKDYPHGTGHQVDCYLSVHGSGGVISTGGGEKPVKAGMVISNEPGYYSRQDNFGIRIESLLVVKERGEMESGKPLLGFDTITRVPIDRRLIAPELMRQDELDWINNYHARVARELGPRLNETERAWLAEATAPIKKPEAPPVPIRHRKMDLN